MPPFGGNANKIELEFEGQDQIALVNNNVGMYINQRYFEIPQATAYQCNANGSITSSSWMPSFVNAENGVVQFNVGSYNTNEYLVLEFAFPVVPTSPPPFSGNLEWCASYGGSNDEQILSRITTDSNGDMYICGSTKSTSLPALGMSQTFGGNIDAFVFKVDGATYPKWATFIGGSDLEEGHKAFLTPTVSGPLLRVIGDTESSDFPINNILYPLWHDDVAFGNPVNQGGASTDEREIFITTLNPTGGTLEHSVFYGTKGETRLLDVEYDETNGFIYLAGRGNVTKLGLSSTLGTNGSGFIAKLNDNDLLINFSGNFGNSNKTLDVKAIKVDNAQNVFIGGRCEDGAINLGVSNGTSNTIQNSYAGGPVEDGFIAKINHTNYDLAWATYYGGSTESIFDFVADIEIDGSGDVYYSILTSADDLPLSNNGDSHNGGDDIYFLKTNNDGEEIFSTYIGNASDELFAQLELDQDDNIYIYSTARIAQTPSTFGGFTQKSWLTYYDQPFTTLGTPNRQPFLLVKDKNLNDQWGTFFSGNHGTFSSDIHIGKDDKLYITGFLPDVTNFFDPNVMPYNFPFKNPLPNSATNSDEELNLNHGDDIFVARFDLYHYVNIKQQMLENTLHVYPNPSKGNFIIELPNVIQDFNIEVVDVLGKQVYLSAYQNHYSNIELNLNHLSSGTYFVRILDDYRLFTQKIVITK